MTDIQMEIGRELYELTDPGGRIFANQHNVDVRGATGGGWTLFFSFFSFGGLGATLGAVSVTPVDGGTDDCGAAFSFGLFLRLSFGGGATGVVAGGTDTEGAAEGAGFSLRLFFLSSGVVAGVVPGLIDGAALGAGDTLSFRLFFLS